MSITSNESLISQIEEMCHPIYNKIMSIVSINQDKVLNSYKKYKVGEEFFKGSTGYGYNDHARDTMDQIFADILGTESALVRSQIVSGTHALSLVLFGLLKPNDHILSLTGTPYDTLLKVIGYPIDHPCSLRELGISYDEIQLTQEGKPDLIKIKDYLNKNQVKLVLIQRSRGYAWRNSLSIEDIKELIRLVKNINNEIICMVDNCYGEFVESIEPTNVGADIIAGSLIKNPGGGLVPTGGYIAGKENLVERISYKLTAPGIGGEVGSISGDFYRLLYQGIFLAPSVVGEALKGAIFTAALFSQLGYDVLPRYDQSRSDIVQAIKLGSEDKIVKFCKGIQEASPIDSYVTPVPWDMPGYENKVIMAGGTFIQGSTIELSTDAPIRDPYAVYLQGGLSYTHTKIAVLNALKHIE